MPSLMLQETLSCPEKMRFLIDAGTDDLQQTGATLRAVQPRWIATIARGSSDHAAGYIGYHAMCTTGIFAGSLPPSIASIERAPLHGAGGLAIAVSQSGASPDVIAPARALTEQGAYTVALVNQAQSGLANAVTRTVGLRAGPELSVAATKSFVNSLLAGYLLIESWHNTANLQAALRELLDLSEQALTTRWDAHAETLARTERCMVLGRGYGQSVACEMALKLKETCQIQAEAFSGAEVRHGPMALIHACMPMLVVALAGKAFDSQIALAQEMRARGAPVILAAPAGTPGVNIPLVSHRLSALNPILATLSLYRYVEHLCRQRGLDPDRPPQLQKVTETT